ncbi:MAG: WG repeat-containing protein, partial [Saprospiraceae bacterium]
KPIELIYSSPELGNLEYNKLSQFDDYSDFFVPRLSDINNLFQFMKYEYEYWSEDYDSYDPNYIISITSENIDNFEDGEFDPSTFSSSVKEVIKNGKKGLFNVQTAKLILSIEFDEIEPTNILGKCVICNKGKFGVYCVVKNKIIIPCNYDKIEFIKSALKQDQYIVLKDNKYGVVNELNKIIVSNQFDELFYHQAGYLPVDKGALFGRKEQYWSVIGDDYQIISNFTSSRKVGQFQKIQFADLFGLANEKGDLLLPPIFKTIEKKNKLIFANSFWYNTLIFKENLEFFIEGPCSDAEILSDKLFRIKQGYVVKILSFEGDLIFEYQCESLTIQKEVLFARKEKEWHIVDLDGQILKSGPKLKELDKSFRSSEIYLAGGYKGLKIEIKKPKHKNKKVTKEKPVTKTNSKLEELRQFINDEIKHEQTITGEEPMAMNKRPRIRKRIS